MLIFYQMFYLFFNMKKFSKKAAIKNLFLSRVIKKATLMVAFSYENIKVISVLRTLLNYKNAFLIIQPMLRLASHTLVLFFHSRFHALLQ
jgi:hypothetical protein